MEQNLNEMKELFDELLCGEFTNLNEYTEYINNHILRVEVTDDEVLLSRGKYHYYFNKNENEGELYEMNS